MPAKDTNVAALPFDVEQGIVVIGESMDPSVAAKVERAFSKYPRRIYPKGDILVFAGDKPKHIFYLKTGRVRKYDVSYRGDEVVVNVFKSGAFFPMSWALNDEPNHYFYKTETATELYAVPVDNTLQFLRDNPDVVLDLLNRLYRGTEGLLGRMVHLMSGTAKSRLLYELIIECRRFSEPNGLGDRKLGVSEVDLAARSGLSRETVSREIGKLKDAGLVSLDGKTIVVHDLSALEQVLGSEI